LRVGYVSGDFREHSVAYFLEPVLRGQGGHDRAAVEVFCYADQRKRDAMTERLVSFGHQWRWVAGMSDDAVAELVRKDGIDVLVDLAGHSAENRLLVFARKPAPVQVTWLGYPNTTGLSAMDYRVTDAVADPPDLGEDERYSEKLVRLPRCFLCYGMEREWPEVGTLPAQANGFVTFGSFNNIGKVSERTMRLWGKVLQAAPGARLLLKYRSLGDEGTRRVVREAMAKCGVDVSRVEMVGHVGSHVEHLKLYGRVDVGLDTTPYCGTTTTCEAMAMGVPVVTLAGNSHVSRVGASLMTAVGMGEMAAASEDAYVSIAVKVAGDVENLKHVRLGLRERMRGSGLCDAVSFAREMEGAMRRMVLGATSR
jgi:predicted O-linked N-acetylglucosamine transferase (SPINDLY family)